MRLLTVITLFFLVINAISETCYSTYNKPPSKKHTKNAVEVPATPEEKETIPEEIWDPSVAIYNESSPYSPILLNEEWSTVWRLITVFVTSCLGTTGNGFFVSSFFVEAVLRKAGNTFLACIGLTDLIVTTGVMPVSVVVILSSGLWDSLILCRSLQFLTEAATYGCSLFFLFLSFETFCRLCRPPEDYNAYIIPWVRFISISISVVSVIMSGLGVYFHLDYDYCERCRPNNWTYRLTTSIIFHILPSIFTFVGLISSYINLQRRAREQAGYRRSQQYERDHSTTTLHVATHVLFVASWLPYLGVMMEKSVVTDPMFYHSIWFALLRTVFSNFLYCSINKNFRRAFSHLFNYCFCKIAMTASFNRHRRAMHKAASGDVRVHIMHRIVASTGQQRYQRGASSSREAYPL